MRILTLTTAFLTSVTEGSTVLHIKCVVPTRSLLTDKLRLDLVVFAPKISINKIWKRGSAVVRHLPLVLEVPGSIP